MKILTASGFMNESNSESRSPALAGALLPPLAGPAAPLPRGLRLSSKSSDQSGQRLTLLVDHHVHHGMRPLERLE